ncbi:unnamed protein product [Didymodactylos carnosus]|uniref:Uncharacterized protein n=1 Tax=Didymodactylos carnosus TaxID=1234261 RepID=A0A814JTT2_9BILA|nr:unnamed protein product [Didymodactylos carnosus]CAF1042338.1 unnamed protein product [Didymodactylos carnosus]CAF3601947.1 unnamed protein product [Didymodactylos carnosus]CAF3812488.1 unnamed protein product [Didymodactylos carnosus]
MAKQSTPYHQNNNQVQYTTIVPPNAIHTDKKQTESDRVQAVYVNYDDAFQEDETVDYFGQAKYHISQNAHHQQQHVLSPPRDNPLHFYLQSVETISETHNNSQNRYYSKDNSRSSTPSTESGGGANSLAFQRRLYPQLRGRQRRTDVQSKTPDDELSPDLINLRLNNPSSHTHSHTHYHEPVPFTPESARLDHLSAITSGQIKIQQSGSTDDYLNDASDERKNLLPQHFLVKYLGRTPCTSIWGAKAVRGPIDAMIHSAHQLPTMADLPTLEARISTKGLLLTQRLHKTNNHRHRDRSSKKSNHSPQRTGHSRAFSPLRHVFSSSATTTNKDDHRNSTDERHGLIPLENISYVMHDMKYTKVSACIVLRQKENETITECYALLFQNREYAQRFALALAEAFNTKAVSKQQQLESTQEKPSRSSRQPVSNAHSRKDVHPRRSKHRRNEDYLRDSEV